MYLFTGVVPTLVVFSLMFVVVYLLGYLVIFRDWGGKYRSEASSCLISLAHGIPAVALAAYSLLRSQNGNFASPNTNFQDILLDYSISYFFIDLLHYIFFIPSEVLFIAHHLATLYVFSTCRFVVHHGAYALIVLLLLAEVTSPCQNAWTLAGFRKAHVPEAALLYEFLSPVFYAFYSVARGLLGPLVVHRMVAFFASGAAEEAAVPRWAWISWMIVIISAILVSIIWVLNLWMHINKQEQKKLS